MCDTLATSFDLPATVQQERFCIALCQLSARALQPHRRNPYTTLLSRFSFYSIVFQHCYRHLLLHHTDCLLLRFYDNFYRRISFSFFLLNFFRSDRFALSIFNFLHFSLGIPFCIPATLSGCALYGQWWKHSCVIKKFKLLENFLSNFCECVEHNGLYVLFNIIYYIVMR